MKRKMSDREVVAFLHRFERFTVQQLDMIARLCRAMVNERIGR
jgi:hypothetical protein